MERLRHIIERAHLQARDGAFDFGNRRDDDDGGLRPAGRDLSEQRDAIHLRHAQIGNDERCRSLFELAQRFDTRSRLGAREAFAFEQADEDATQPRFVIHDQTSHSGERWHGGKV